MRNLPNITLKKEKGNTDDQDNYNRNQDNLHFCKQLGIRLSGKPLGRPKREPDIDKKKDRRKQVERIEAERSISHALHHAAGQEKVYRFVLSAFNKRTV